MKKSILVLCIIACSIAGGTASAQTAAQTYGPVQPNESLYRIALKFRQPGISVSQLMMSIFEANPDAFDAGNINRLKVGASLKIPERSTIAATNLRQAHRKATSHIESYEQEIRATKVEKGELAPLAQLPRDPELIPEVVPIAQASQIESVKQELEAEQQLLPGGALPEPKAATQRRRQKPKAPPLRYSYDVAVVNDDNVRLAQADDDIRDDLILSGTLKATGGRPLDSFSIWNYGASLTYEAFDTFDELNHYDFEVNTRYRFALASGFTSPIYTLGAKIGGMEFDSEMRDSTVLTLSADLNKWITNTINMTAGLGLKKRESVSEVYDLDEARLFVNFDINFSKTDLVYTTLTFVTGDIASSATPTIGIINVSDAIEPDDAFGGIDANQFAYRIEADTWVVTLGYNRIISPDLSFDISARFVDSTAVDDDDIGYERTIVRASLLGRF